MSLKCEMSECGAGFASYVKETISDISCDSCYLRPSSTSMMTWIQAFDFCQNQEAHLAVKYKVLMILNKHLK